MKGHYPVGKEWRYVDLVADPGRYKDGSASTLLMVLDAALKDPDLRSMLVT
jgi:hypothetical protein